MHSVLLDPPSPDQLHSNFSQAANGAAQAIKQFTQLVEDSRTKEVMEKAKESRAENGEGIAGWQVAEHEDWLDIKQEDGNDDVDKEEGNIADASGGSSMNDVNAALDKFRSAHKGVEVSLDEESRTVTVRHLYSFIWVTLKVESSIYLHQLRLVFRFSSIQPPKARIITALTAKANQSSTEQFLRLSEQGQKQTI